MTTPTPIATFEDILAAMEQNPQLQAAMRQHVLDQEFLQLPAIVRELQQTVAELAQLVRDYIVATDARLERLEADVAEVKADVAELKTDVGTLKTEVGTLTQRVDTLTERVGTMSGTVSRLAGEDYESHVCNYAERVLRRQLGIDAAVFSTQRHKEPLSKLLNEAETQGRLLPEEVDDLDEADLILTSHAPEGYVAVEISITIQQTDVDRATTRAALLAKATSQNVMPVVAGTVQAPNLSMGTAQAIFIPERPNSRQTPTDGNA